MSHLTAAETLDFGEVASLPKRWVISLSGGERCTWRSRRLVCPTCNRSHLVSHPSSEGKHLRQRWRDRRLQNALSSSLRAIHHGEHLLRIIVLLYCKGLFRRSMHIYGRPNPGKFVHTSINVWSLRSFWVRITTHKYFLSSGSDCPRTNCSLINSWRSSGELCGYYPLGSQAGIVL